MLQSQLSSDALSHNSSSEFEAYKTSPAFSSDHIEIKLETTAVKPIQNGLVKGFSCGWRDIYFSPEDLKEINAIFNVLQIGPVSLEGLSTAAKISLPVVKAFIKTFYELGIVEIVSQDEIPGIAFFRHTVARMRARRHKMLREHPVLPLNQPEKLHRRLLLGYLVETYHFVAAASSHISLAIAQADTPLIETVLSQYLADEYWHGNLLLKGIVKSGLEKEAIQYGSPSFPILGIINFLRETARKDLQAYGLCLALSEINTSGNTLFAHRQEIWDNLQKMNLVSPETLQAFYEHDRLDFNAKHDDAPEIIFANGGNISWQRQKKLMHTAALYIDMVGDAYKYLASYYASPNGNPWFEIQ